MAAQLIIVIFNYGIKNRFLIFLIIHKAAYPSGN